jgi:hypothetical protein
VNPIRYGGVTPRPHRHRWISTGMPPVPPLVVCADCGKGDDGSAKRGKQSRNYGNRAELAVAKQYGGRKVGHAQGPTDIMGTTTKTQLKTTRRAPPLMWLREFAKLDSERDGRLPRLLLRFVRPGNLGPDDYFVVRGRDWLEWFGRDE